MVDDDLAHGAAHQPNQVLAVFDRLQILVEDFQKGFVNQGGGLQRRRSAGTGLLVMGQAPDVVVDQFGEPLERVGLALDLCSSRVTSWRVAVGEFIAVSISRLARRSATTFSPVVIARVAPQWPSSIFDADLGMRMIRPENFAEGFMRRSRMAFGLVQAALRQQYPRQAGSADHGPPIVVTEIL